MSEATRHEVKVSLGERSYSILIGRGLLRQAGSILGRLLRQPRVILVIDANLVATDHDVMLRRSLHEAGITVHPVEVAAGEASKSHATYAWLMDEILALGVDRKVTVIAFGGGVIGDLAGFVAASLLRGVDFVQIPTTLLSQVDSSVGGKTGINSRHGKNLIGAFHQPGIVLIDTAVLDSLPERELRSGYAEIIKYGCIIDADFFDWLLSHGADMLDGDPELRARAIRRSVEIKAAIVADDERETSGVRALLNFGHTFAHAYEALAGYNGTLLHGEAVSIGMVKATRLSADLGLASRDDAVRLHDHLATLNLPTSPRQLRNDGFAVDGLLNAMQRDKKAEDGKMQFVLWRGIGNAFVARDVPLNVLRDRLHEDG
ncbi:MAG: 3-dehydroquinate synthase [Geminicoccaceae bacterium]|nr:3-dehydroquinate synthase [Geminicoccaceae bacterium]